MSRNSIKGTPFFRRSRYSVIEGQYPEISAPQFNMDQRIPTITYKIRTRTYMLSDQLMSYSAESRDKYDPAIAEAERIYDNKKDSTTRANLYKAMASKDDQTLKLIGQIVEMQKGIRTDLESLHHIVGEIEEKRSMHDDQGADLNQLGKDFFMTVTKSCVDSLTHIAQLAKGLKIQYYITDDTKFDNYYSQIINNLESLSMLHPNFSLPQDADFRYNASSLVKVLREIPQDTKEFYTTTYKILGNPQMLNQGDEASQNLDDLLHKAQAKPNRFQEDFKRIEDRFLGVSNVRENVQYHRGGYREHSDLDGQPSSPSAADYSGFTEPPAGFGYEDASEEYARRHLYTPSTKGGTSSVETPRKVVNTDPSEYEQESPSFNYRKTGEGVKGAQAEPLQKFEDLFKGLGNS